MRAIVLEEPGQFRPIEVDAPPALGEDEALVRVRRVGVCGTDFHAFRGRQPFFTYPRILGHELGVELVALGSSHERLAPGDLCAVEPYLNCGACIACRLGKTNCCASLRVLGVHIDGGMQEYLVVPARKLHASRKLSLEQLALVETLGIGAHAVCRAQVRAGEFALILGAGPIGLATAQFARAAGARVIVLEKQEHRLQFVSSQIKVDFAVPADDASAERILEITGGDGPTLVFDATGSVASMNAAFQYPASGGRLVFVGLVQADISFFDPDFHRKELTILSSRNSTGDDFRRIISLIEAGEVDTDPWITHLATWDTLLERFPQWLNPDEGVLKAMVNLDG